MPKGYGYVVWGVGGLYRVRLLPACAKAVPKPYESQPLDGRTVFARGRGNLRRGDGLLIGDFVEVSYDESSYTIQNGTPEPSPDGTGIVISEILPRRSSLIRPPMANLDVLFVTVAAASPAPDYGTLDKLLSIAVYNQILPVVIVNKCDLAPEKAKEIETIYRGAGFLTFSTVGKTGEGVDALKDWIAQNLGGKLAAFAGASGVGKSTLLGNLFPGISFQTGDISRRIARGKNTTRQIEIHPLSEAPDCGYIADTPGFTMLDFEQFDFFDLEDLPDTFPEFAPYLGKCRYTDCTHTKEEECEIVKAVRAGKIAPSRHETYLALYQILKKKPKWK